MIELSPQQIARFHEDGFLILERFIDPAEAARVAARFERLFRGEFETGLYPDEWNWREGRDKPDLARQICNGWKADYTVASLVLRAEIGQPLRPAGGLAGRAHGPGQRHLEAAGRQAARLPPGRQLQRLDRCPPRIC